MNLLLDTHVALWAIVDSPRLADAAKAVIRSPDTQVWVSAASVWEIAIKHGSGRGDMPISGEQALQYFREAGYQLLAIAPEHAALVEKLPAHHADPFDRILAAQALHEPMHLMSNDPHVLKYGEHFIAV